MLSIPHSVAAKERLHPTTVGDEREREARKIEDMINDNFLLLAYFKN